MQSAADDEHKEKSLGSVQSMLHVEAPTLQQRTASALTVLTTAAMEGTVPLQEHTCDYL